VSEELLPTRVTRAIEEALALQKISVSWGCDFTGVNPPLDVEALASAAIAALREPTEAMVSAGDDAVERDSDDRSGSWFYRYHDNDAKSVWLAMVDAAVKNA